MEYQTKPLPAIDWPAFPDIKGQVTSDGERVSMNLDFWLKIARYVVGVESGIEILQAYAEGLDDGQ